MANIQLKNMTKRYGGKVTAVNDFNLDIEDKEFIVFVGPSGCGKSTTLRMIAGLEDITEGELYIDGTLMNDTAPKDRDIAMVFQNYALYPHLNVYDNMAFSLKLRKYKKDKIDQRVKQSARLLGLEEYLDRKPKALSGGQRQRVALGRAIVRDPQVFLMDEPLSNLDAKLRVQMRAEITKLHQRLQTTMIYVTHDQTEAMTMATRIVIMKDGMIQQVGTPKEVYDEPENVFVGGFIGSPPMNFVHGVLEGNIFKVGDESIDILESQYKILKEKGYDNQALILGIRPEHIHDVSANSGISQGMRLNLHIDVAELMGAETYLYATIGGQNIIARVSSQTHVQSGQTLDMVFNMDHFHFFDLESEKRID